MVWQVRHSEILGWGAWQGDVGGGGGESQGLEISEQFAEWRCCMPWRGLAIGCSTAVPQMQLRLRRIPNAVNDWHCHPYPTLAWGLVP